MKPRLDLQKSILKERLIYKMGAKSFLIRLFDNLLWLILLMILILLIFIDVKNHGITIVSLIAGMAILYFSSGLYFINSLIKISGPNLTDNRKRIIEIINEKFPDVVIDTSGQNVLNCKKRTGLINWGKHITIIFNNNDVFMNFTTLGRNNIKSPFHSIINYLKLKQLKKNFKLN